MGDYALKSISPLNEYSRNFKENLLEEVVGMEVISIATSVENKDFLNKQLIEIFDLELPVPGKSHLTSNGLSRLLGLSLDQWLIVSVDQKYELKALLENSLSNKSYVTLQTDAWVCIRISGRSALKALERICPVNLDPDLFLKDYIARTMMEHLGSIVICENPNSYLLMSASSSANSFLDALEVSLRNVI